MVEVINLNKQRKNKNKLEKEKQAEANRIKFGRTKHEKELAKKNSALQAKKLDSHKLEEE